MPINQLTAEGFGMLSGVASASFTGLLDEYPNALAAYSVRLLSSTYEGALMEVRRTVSSVTVTADVAYDSNNELSLDSLITITSGSSSANNLGEFVGASGYSNPDSLGGGQDAFVRTWYDQSGNSRDFIQSSDGAQPQIVNSGSLITDNSIVCLSSNGVKVFTTSYDISSLLNSTIGVFSFSGTNSRLWTTEGSNSGIRNTAGNTLNIRGTSDVIIGSNITTLGQILASTFGTTSCSTFLNGSAGASGNIGSFASGVLEYGASANSDHIGKVQELIYYGSNQLSNRGGIESNINSYYSIYSPPSGIGTWAIGTTFVIQ
jgi:hypothetical protein